MCVLRTLFFFQAEDGIRDLTVPGVQTCFLPSRRRHTRFDCDWSSDVCSSDLPTTLLEGFFGPYASHHPPHPGTKRTPHYVEFFVFGGKSALALLAMIDRKSTRLNSSHSQISYAVFCLKKKKQQTYLHY